MNADRVLFFLLIMGNITDEIRAWLDMPDNVTVEKKFRQGTMLLLQLTGNKYQVNYLNKGWNSNVQKSKLIYELNKHLRIKLSGITLRQIQEMQPEVERIGKEIYVETVPAETPNYENPSVAPSKPIRGKRPDHDLLPPEIQALYVETHKLLQKERSLHERLKLMSDAKPCDRHEYVTMLINLDKRRIEDWKKYDNYVIGQDTKVSAPVQAAPNVAVDATSIGTIRTFLSRNIDKAINLKDDEMHIVDYTKLLAELQSKYETATALGAKFSNKTIKNLQEAGVKV